MPGDSARSATNFWTNPNDRCQQIHALSSRKVQLQHANRLVQLWQDMLWSSVDGLKVVKFTLSIEALDECLDNEKRAYLTGSVWQRETRHVNFHGTSKCLTSEILLC
jgi:hypothetical protein